MGRRRPAIAAALVVTAVGAVACGSQGISSKIASQPENVQHGAQLFSERCSGCHTLDVVGAQGTTLNVRERERVDGPELQHAPRDARQRPLRAAQRRLLGRDHAREHRGREGRRRRRGLPLQVRGQQVAPRAVLDLRLIRRDPDAVRAALARRSPELAERVDELTELDASWREATAAAERLRAEQKAASEGIAAAKQAGEDASDAIARMKDVSAQVKALGETARRAEEELQAVLVTLPNLPDPTAADEDEVMREVGEAGATGADHLELAGERIDMERGARLSGSRFAYLRGDMVLLELALVRWATGEARSATASSPSSRPCSCARRRSTAPASCPTPSSRSTTCPTTTCTWWGPARWRSPRCTPARSSRGCRCATRASRRASGARRAPAGKDTRGIFRVHQFDKLEMFSFVEPDASLEEHERLLAHRGGDHAGARDPLSRGQHRRGRPRRQRGQEVRLRGVAARPGALPRADLDLEHDRLPGASPADPLPPAGRRRAPEVRAHAQRHRGHLART